MNNPQEMNIRDTSARGASLFHRLLLIAAVVCSVLGSSTLFGGASNIPSACKFIAVGLIVFGIILNLIRTRPPLLDYIVFSIAFILLLLTFYFADPSAYTLASFSYCLTIPLVAVFGHCLIDDADYKIIGLSIFFMVGIVFVFSANAVISQIALVSSRIRLYGGFNHPNQLAGILLVGVFCLIANLAIGVPKRRQKYLLVAITAIMIAVLVLTGSRTSEFSLLIFILALIYLRISGRMKARGKLVFCILILSAIVFATYFFMVDYVFLDANYIGRMNGISGYAYNSIHGWFGYGLLDSAALSSVVNLSVGSTEIAWITILYKIGIVGLAVFITLLIYLAKRSAKYTGQQQASKTKHMLFLALLILVLAQTLGEAFIINITNFPGLFNWVLLSSLSAPACKSRLNRLSQTC